jgi:hypothetical protein
MAKDKDYKEEAMVMQVEVTISNIVSFNIKSNDSGFAQQWLKRQLAPTLKHLPPEAKLQVNITGRLPDNHEEYAAEVYGVPTDGECGEKYEVFEQVKNNLFGEDNANSGD